MVLQLGIGKSGAGLLIKARCYPEWTPYSSHQNPKRSSYMIDAHRLLRLSISWASETCQTCMKVQAVRS